MGRHGPTLDDAGCRAGRIWQARARAADPDTLLLLDTASLYFRAFFGVPDTMTAPDGTPINAVRGLLDLIARLVSDRTPDRLVACMDDDWRPPSGSTRSRRTRRTGSPTGDGEEVPDALSPQVADHRATCSRRSGIAVRRRRGYEADDVIGTLADPRSPGPVDVVTGDRDLFQLVDDARPVRVLYTARGVARPRRRRRGRGDRTKYGIPRPLLRRLRDAARRPQRRAAGRCRASATRPPPR